LFTWLIRQETKNKQAKLNLVKGQEIEIITDPNSPVKEYSDEKSIFMNLPDLAEVVRPGSPILLDDGFISLQVKEIRGPHSVICTIMNSGEIGERRNASLPGAVVSKALQNNDAIRQI
jgi:pyruvate kinase